MKAEPKRLVLSFTPGLLVVCLVILGSSAILRAQKTNNPPRRVLVLYWDNKNFPGNVKFDESFQSVLRSKSPDVEYYPEYLETTRFPGQDQTFFYDYLQKKYAGRDIDVVVSSADPVLDFLLKYRKDLFPNSPMVFVASEPPPSEMISTGPGMTGILNQSTRRQTLELALKLHPNTKKVFVISGTPDHDKRFENLARADLSDFTNRVEIEYLTDLPLKELSARTATLPSDSVGLFLWQQAQDEHGRLLETFEVLARVASSSAVPIYGMNSFHLGQGIVGGYLQGPDYNGARVGEIVLQLLSGTRAQDIPVAGAPTVLMFDWRELKHWGISETTLPPGSIVLFQQFTFWEIYKWRILGVLSLLILQTAIIAFLLVERRRRQRAVIEQERLNQVAESTHRRLGEIVSNVPGIVWETVIDPATQQRKTTFISNYVQKMLGHTPDEWLAQPPGFGSRIMVEEDRLRVSQESEEVVATGRNGVSQFRWRTKDGRIVWAENYLSPIVSDGQTVGLRGVTLDITDRKLAEESQRRTEEKDRAILEALPDLMFLQTRDGVYVDFHCNNPADLLAAPEEFLGKNMSDILPPELADKMAHYFQQAVDTGEIQIVEYELTLGGTQRCFEARLVSTGDNILSVVRNITEQRRANDKLRQSEERFSKAFRANPQPMSLATAAGGRYVDVNDSFLAMIGYTRDEVIGRTSLDLRIWETQEARETFIRELNERSAIVNREIKFRAKDGSFRILLSSAEQMEIGGEQCLLMASSDITDRKASEAALVKAHLDLETAYAEVNRLKNQLEEENIYLREEIKLVHNFDEIVGESDALKYILFKIEQVAPTDSTVLVTGETGTGKELVARAIHGASRRSDRPLVKVNCAALSASLIESELFGHEKGSFTGATARKIGRFELADRATIFLDEIGELPPELQVKLLRVIQEGEFERLGSSKTLKVDVRIIAATNRNLKEQLNRGLFREDLWYRLNVFPISVPPLRQRRDDIPILVEHFAQVFSRKFGKAITSIAPATINALRNYSWPGNVRELATIIERAVITSHGSVLQIEKLHPVGESDLSPAKTLEEIERDYIIRILDDRNWRIEGPNGAAHILGINPSTLRTRMAKLGIHKATMATGSSQD